jgi:hypothetical protein
MGDGGDLVCDSYLSSGDRAIGIKRGDSIHTQLPVMPRTTEDSGQMGQVPQPTRRCPNCDLPLRLLHLRRLLQ